MEGSGAGSGFVQINYGSGCRSRRPKKIWIGSGTLTSTFPMQHCHLVVYGVDQSFELFTEKTCPELRLDPIRILFHMHLS
jgi:hypothetical protein